MSNIAISIENLSKKYKIGSVNNDFRHAFSAIFKSKKENKDKEENILWALKNVSFDINQGEVIGIIGRNGAGKSTLLKILSRVTEPTKGKITINGRVASLLEVGTGFNLELTGRENIFLNGTILGMRRAEIKAKFDEIVDFSGIEKFIDTPIKHYSSGMYVRLAFAVAAHLEPEILIIDEVLAVGDSEFQKKCIGKMGEVSKNGRTILFVSHNLTLVENLCNRGLVLKDGAIDFPLGETSTAINHYVKSIINNKSFLKDRRDREGKGEVIVTKFEIYNKHGQRLDMVISGHPVEFRVYYEKITSKKLKNVSASIRINIMGSNLLCILTNIFTDNPFIINNTEGYFSCVIEKFPLTTNSYSIGLLLAEGAILQDWLQESMILDVIDGDYFKTGHVIPNSHGGVLIDQKWNLY